MTRTKHQRKSSTLRKGAKPIVGHYDEMGQVTPSITVNGIPVDAERQSAILAGMPAWLDEAMLSQTAMRDVATLDGTPVSIPVADAVTEILLARGWTSEEIDARVVRPAPPIRVRPGTIADAARRVQVEQTRRKLRSQR